jgi:deoxyribodipyrimidine photo-lyase
MLYDNGLFIFRRDLRIIDNIGLNLANTKCKNIYTVFIFTPEQVSSANKFKSDNSVQFMIESLADLQKQIKKMGGNLLTFYGKNETIVEELIKNLKINCLFVNADYSPYAINRELNIIKLCDKMGVLFYYGDDYYLHPPGTILNSSGNPYQKFTPFYEASLRKKVEPPLSLRQIHFSSTTKQLKHHISLDEALKRFTKVNQNILVHGGRDNALKQMKIAAKNIKDYSKTHNSLTNSTSELSAYIKFGCLSIREVYHFFKKSFGLKHGLIRELLWREFFAHVLYAYPNVVGNSYQKIYKNN